MKHCWFHQAEPYQLVPLNQLTTATSKQLCLGRQLLEALGRCLARASFRRQ